MKKNKKHRWKYQINIKKKAIVSIILGVSLFVGLGYAILGSNFGITGTLEVGKYDRTIAGVMRKNAGNGYILKYTGAHQDSMDPTKSTEDIYYFTADTAAKAATVKNMNNVVFADMCWSIVRTTDTGGVKMYYNGVPDTTIVDGVTQYDCSESRNKYALGGIKEEINLNGTKKYASSYTTTTSNNGKTVTFTLVDPQSITVNSTNAAEQIANIVENYPYTCNSTSNSCSVPSKDFYEIVNQSTGTNAYVYKTQERDSITNSEFNGDSSSISSAGYMFGDVGEYGIMEISDYYDYMEPSSNNIHTTTKTLGTSYYYASTYDYGVTTANKFTLTSPTQITSETNYSDLVGMYIVNNSGSVNNIYYVIGVSGSTAYVKTLSGSDQDISISFSSSLNSSFNALDNPTTVELKYYYQHYSDYVDKYTCGNSATSCSSPRYLTYTSATSYRYLTGTITVATGRNGLVLTNPVTLSKGEFYQNYEDVYENYRYTCGNNDTTCTETNLKYINEVSGKDQVSNPTLSLDMNSNHYYGESVVYENNQYTLQNTVDFEAGSDVNVIATHHYVCLEIGAKTCQKVAYLFNAHEDSYAHYVMLSNGAEDVDDIFDAQLRTNTVNSVAKNKIDAWYEDKLLNTPYESKLDDIIFCNNRSFKSPDEEYNVDFAPLSISGWNPNGGNPLYSLAFENAWEATDVDLSCKNVTDRFSVSNNVARLTYKIAMPETSDVVLGKKAFGGVSEYWEMTPSGYCDGYPYGDEAEVMINYAASDGSTGGVAGDFYYGEGLRPAIALTAETIYARGNGSGTNPFVVDMSN